MTKMTEYPAGTRSWADLSSPDLDGSSGFYGGPFGWEAQEGEPPELTGGYRMLYCAATWSPVLAPSRRRNSLPHGRRT